MKKIIGLIIAFVLCFSLCACQESSNETTEDNLLDKTVYFHECEYKVSSDWEEGDQSDFYQYYYPEKTFGVQVCYDSSISSISKIKDMDAYVERNTSASDFTEISRTDIGVNGAEGIKIKATAKKDDTDVYLSAMVFNVPSGIMCFLIVDAEEEPDTEKVDSLSEKMMNTIKIEGVEAFLEETTESETEKESKEKKTTESTTEEETESTTKEIKTIETTEEETEEETETTTEEVLNSIVQEAMKTAKTYLGYIDYSYSGLVNQLELEGYSNTDAVKAVEMLGIDWNEQALKCANAYIVKSKMTKKEVKKQMKADGFTDSQIEYAIENADFD